MKSAVDEGINPYGKPSRGNYDQAWNTLGKLPCPWCGAISKELSVDQKAGKITITCKGTEHADAINL